MIIDFHTHIFPPYFSDRRDRFFGVEPAFKILYEPPESVLAGEEDLLMNMDAEGVRKSVVFGFPWKDPEHFRRHNDYIIESVQRHPDRLIGFCCFDPLAPDAAREAERCLEAGLSGIGELALYESDLSAEAVKAFGDLMETALRFDVPLLLHTNEPVGHEYPGKTGMTLKQIYDFVRAFPRNKIVLAHWGGGICFYGLMRKAVREVMSNVYFDTAASPFLYRPDIYRIAGEIVGFEKILFGSDYPLLKPGRYFKEMASSRFPIPSLEDIRGKNAAHLLDLTPGE